MACPIPISSSDVFDVLHDILISLIKNQDSYILGLLDIIRSDNCKAAHILIRYIYHIKRENMFVDTYEYYNCVKSAGMINILNTYFLFKTSFQFNITDPTAFGLLFKYDFMNTNLLTDKGKTLLFTCPPSCIGLIAGQIDCTKVDNDGYTALYYADLERTKQLVQSYKPNNFFKLMRKVIQDAMPKCTDYEKNIYLISEGFDYHFNVRESQSYYDYIVDNSGDIIGFRETVKFIDEYEVNNGVNPTSREKYLKKFSPALNSAPAPVPEPETVTLSKDLVKALLAALTK